jgi:hypothetical protein
VDEVYYEPAKLLKKSRRVVLLITGADLVLVKMTKATTTAAHPTTSGTSTAAAAAAAAAAKDGNGDGSPNGAGLQCILGVVLSTPPTCQVTQEAAFLYCVT